MKNKLIFNTIGVMLDCSRNAVKTVPELKRYFDLLSKMGYNRFMLYTEDTYEVKDEPFFGYLRGRYSMVELRELDDYAASKGIELVPCIQTLAHLNAIFRWDAYSSLVDVDDILLAGDDCTYKLIEEMISTLRKCFKTNKIHIGLDEAHKLGKGRYRDINGERNPSEIFLDHLNVVCDIADKYGFEPMMWSDMFYRLANGGEYYKTDSKFDKSISTKIPEKLTLVYWDYYHLEEDFYAKKIEEHKQLTDRVAFAGGAYNWAGWIPHNTFSNATTKAAFSACAKGGVEDVLITIWGDDGAEGSHCAVLPVLCTAACVAQGITDEIEIKAKFAEWTGADYDAFMLIDSADTLRDTPVDVMINATKYQLYNDCFMGIYDKGAVCEGDGDHYAEVSRNIKENISKVGDYYYIFETTAALCDVLELKAEIGVKTRKAYKSGNKDELAALIPVYEEMAKRTDEFYRLFKKQWYKENKPNGFEIQTVRIGGLITRMRDCRERLEAYCIGKFETLSELDEELLGVVEGKPMCNLWRTTFSASVLSQV